MEKEKYLITGGCSFAETVSDHIDTWPRHLAKELSDYTHISTGMSSQGNDLISRKVMFETFNLLDKGVSSDNILVCVMWSGWNRSCVYSHNRITEVTPKNNSSEYIIENPTSVADDNRFYITNPWWAKTYRYVENFYMAVPPEQLKMQSFEHILRTQDFFKANKIKCCMMQYTNEVLDTEYPAVPYLNRMIDKDLWATEQGCYEWCVKNTGIPFPKNDNHPSTEQHKIFTDKVIMSYLRGKNYV